MEPRPMVFHFRVGSGKEMQSKAGATVVFLPEAKRMGIALCCPKDRYNRKWGRKIAEHRAKHGNGSRIRNHRFDSNVEYDGPQDVEMVRKAAKRMAFHAADAVHNPLMESMMDADLK
jgi:hypothetical protein